MVIWYLIVLSTLSEFSDSKIIPFLTAHPNMKKYLRSLKSEPEQEETRSLEDNLCNTLAQDVRIYQAIHPEYAGSIDVNEWNSLFNFASLDKVSSVMEKRDYAIGVDGYPVFKNRLLCFKNEFNEWYLVFNLDRAHSDKILLVHDMENKRYDPVALLQYHIHSGYARGYTLIGNHAIGRNYLDGIRTKEMFQDVREYWHENEFCSLDVYQLYNLCSTALEVYWNHAYFDIDDDMNAPQRYNIVQISKQSCSDGEVTFPTNFNEPNVKAKFLPCYVINHELTTEFHLTPSSGVFMAKDKQGNGKYHLYAHVFHIHTVQFQKNISTKIEKDLT